MVYYNVLEYILNVVTNRMERLELNFKVHESIQDMLHFKDLDILATITSIIRDFKTKCFHFINFMYNTACGRIGRAMFSSDFNKPGLQFWGIQFKFFKGPWQIFKKIKKMAL